uniref:NADH-ubiquinone oxidoreductase chain 3 n=1 Tax=Parastrongyloides trichosuri TaxID=131310 RepID=A0A173MZW7_PARTI|nr:NADH dehydrogenase subunit 3 [Parastrongyloides trichosuri]
MFILFLVFLFALFFILLFYLLNFVLSFKLDFNSKISSFESGFVSVGLIQNSFSIHFFIIMLMFVIFDLEIVMFLGVIISDLNSFFSFLVLIFFVLLGFYMEWWYGKLLWAV